MFETLRERRVKAKAEPPPPVAESVKKMEASRLRLEEMTGTFTEQMETANTLLVGRITDLRVSEERDEILSSGLEEIMSTLLDDLKTVPDADPTRPLLLKVTNDLARLLSEADERGEEIKKFLEEREEASEEEEVDLDRT